MSLRLVELDWHEEHVQRIARHHVDPQEVEDVCFSPRSRIETGRGGGGVYYVTGRTDEGRYLMVVVRSLGHGRAKVITARDMDSREKFRYRRK